MAGPSTDAKRRIPLADLGVALGAVLLAPFVMTALPEGSLLRLGLILGILLIAPGYLLMAAVEPAAGSGRRWGHVAMAVGLGPAVVGLAALSTTMEQGGFRIERIMAALAILSAALAAAAFLRRRHAAKATPPVVFAASPEATPTPAVSRPPLPNAEASGASEPVVAASAPTAPTPASEAVPSDATPMAALPEPAPPEAGPFGPSSPAAMASPGPTPLPAAAAMAGASSQGRSPQGAASPDESVA